MVSSTAKPVTLPPNLIDLYQFYKTRTAAAVAWLTSESGVKYKTVAQLIWAAKTLVGKGVEPPSELLSTLTDALRARIEIAAYYRVAYPKCNQGADERLQGHEYFSNTLKHVILLLFPQCDLDLGEVLSTQEPDTDKPRSESQWSNMYEALAEIDERVDAAHTQETAATQSTDEDVSNTRRHTAAEEDGTACAFAPLVDDTLAIDMEFVRVIVEFDVVSIHLKDIWAEARANAISVMFAASLTNAAYRLLDGMILRAKNALAVTSHRVFLKTLQRCMPLLNAYLGPADEGSTYRVFAQGHGFIAPFTALTQWLWASFGVPPSERAETLLKVRSQVFEDADRMLADECMGTFSSEFLKKEEACYISLQTSLCERLKIFSATNDSNSGYGYDGHMFPCLPSLLHCFDLWNPQFDTMFVYGLQLHCEIFRWFRGDRRSTHCRVMALKFAKDVHKALQPVLQLPAVRKALKYAPWQLEILTGFNDFLQTYGKDSRWDLYNQSPWTAGSNMIRIQMKAATLGLILCYNNGALGTVLHLYHCFRELKMVEKPISLFESLMGLLKHVCFPGGLPTSNFYSHLCRFLGGKIDFAGSSFARNFNGKAFVLDWPKQLPRTTDKRRRFDAKKLSLFHALEESNHDMDKKMLIRVFSGAQAAHPETYVESINTKNGIPFRQILSDLRSTVCKEFEGDFPIIKVNWLAVYITCQQVLETFLKHWTDHVITDLPDFEGPEWARPNNEVIAIASIVSFFNSIDTMEEALGPKILRRLSLKETMPECLLSTTIAFESVKDGHDLSKYLWDI